MRYVIIGGSAAAIGCIEGVRSVDKTGEIILITGETEWNYSRPLISYLLEGKTTRDKLRRRPDSLFTRNGVTVKAGVLATTLDAGDRTVRLSSRRAAGLRAGRRRPRAAARSCRPFPGWKRWSVPFASRRCPTPRLWLGRRCGRRAACSFWARASRGVKRAEGHPRPVRADRHCGPLRPACCLLYWMTRGLPRCRPVWRRRASVFT